MNVYTDRVRVPVDAIEHGSHRLEELADQVNDFFDQLGNAASGISSDGSWKGKDADAFLIANQANQRKYQQTIENLSELAKGLHDYAANIQSVDAEWAQKIRAI